MKQFFLVLSLSIFCLSPSFAQQHSGSQLEWYTDLAKAYQKSKATNKPIFGFFTGSDWCGWCHKLQADVFNKPAFVKWAKDKVILLELDFPRRKQLPAELAQQNNSLQQAFQVQGFPTIWIFTAAQDQATQKFSLTPFGSLGYPAGSEVGKEEVKFLNDANAILSKVTVAK
ncbi:MAG: thioredoxin [Flavipsychrobacter sp.]|jgi:protein disulfide-isomerase|nr:thioredoxin [Flavipsychrobacter sp.]